MSLVRWAQTGTDHLLHQWAFNHQYKSMIYDIYLTAIRPSGTWAGKKGAKTVILEWVNIQTPASHVPMSIHRLWRPSKDW